MSIRELHWFRFACDINHKGCFGDRTSWGTSIDDAARKLVKDGWQITNPLGGGLLEMEASGIVVTCPAYAEQPVEQTTE